MALTLGTLCRSNSGREVDVLSRAARPRMQPPAKSCPVCHQREAVELHLLKVGELSAHILIASSQTSGTSLVCFVNLTAGGCGSVQRSK